MNFGIKVKISITEALNEATLSVLDGNKKACNLNKIISCITGSQGESIKNKMLLYLQLIKKKRLENNLNIIENTAFSILQNEFTELFQEK